MDESAHLRRHGILWDDHAEHFVMVHPQGFAVMRNGATHATQVDLVASFSSKYRDRRLAAAIERAKALNAAKPA